MNQKWKHFKNYQTKWLKELKHVDTLLNVIVKHFLKGQAPNIFYVIFPSDKEILLKLLTIQQFF